MPATDVDFRFPAESAAPVATQGGEFVRFGLRAVRVKKKVEVVDGKPTIVDVEAEAGRPIFEDREYIEIRAPGDRLNVVHKEVTQDIRQRYATQYKAWKAGQDQDAAVGTPLAMWPQVTSSDVETFKYQGIRTVEQLAALSETTIQALGPGYRKLKQRATDFLAASKDGAAMTKLRAENEEMSKRLAHLEKLAESQAEMLAELKPKKAK